MHSRTQFMTLEDKGHVNACARIDLGKRMTQRLPSSSLTKTHITDWVTEQRKRYWQLAGRMARHSDGRWSNAVLIWKPQGWRHAGSPCKRWSDDIEKYHTHHFGGSRNDWIISAQDLQKMGRTGE